MSRKLNSFSALFALTLMAFAATSAMAQIDRVKPNADNARVKGPTLGCCKCLGETNTLDLSTISSNNWTVTNVTNNGATNPVVFLTQINSAWNINPGPAQWVSAPAGSSSPVDFDYKLSFFVAPDCRIPQTLTLAGNYGGDNNVSIYLDTITVPSLIASCTGNWCFSTSHQSLPTFSKTIIAGPHTLIVRVNNIGGPSGMFINAHLTRDCAN